MEKGREKNNRYTWRRKKGIKEEKEEAEGRGNNQSEGARVLQTRGSQMLSDDQPHSVIRQDKRK